ncbi:winged helix-turn-helix domain-containing protein [Thalassomonas viridans]|uniref:Winged helix-turn-helix domain-containing protein n=1 Tax=Thalassomonas viridans TaxID=137584 RepID=A0AAE9Z408_9GAMM|nr:winged helix-turn-helix domain-containing protein [Thalassomonas viridans]WDE04838.1 winged helix-turn-helix domain-containing protein [Thalassomonas viridans]
MKLKNNFFSLFGREKTVTAGLLHKHGFSCGKLRVFPSQNRILFDGQSISVQPKIMELLVLLCAASGETVSKEKLTAELWPDVHVGPDSLANTMTRLRRALGDSAKKPLFIETVQSKGYRWLQAVTVEQAGFKANKPGLALLALVLLVAGGSFFLPDRKHEEAQDFPYTDLYIEQTEEGLLVEVGIKGELTEEKKAQMFEDIKRITGQENTGMQFTLDDPDVCRQTAGTTAQPAHCRKGRRAQQD